MPATNLSRRAQRGAWLGGLLLLVALLAAYSNHFQNGFHFDDSHTIVNNAAIHELHNLPRFFRDATTFSALPSNQSYRPLVSSLLAVDYWLGGGLKPLWFHVNIFALFLALVFLLWYLLARLLSDSGYESFGKWIALGAAALYGLHPANADTVNYIIASSDLISTLGIVASLAAYLAFPCWRRTCLYVLPAALTVLAKPPAAIFPVLFALYLLLFRQNESRSHRLFHWIGEIAPSFLLCGAALWLVKAMTPRTWVGGAANPHNYLLTQPYVSWLYSKTFFWPASLSADYDLNPLTSTNDPRFWMGIAFLLLVIALAVGAIRARKMRLIGFGLLWFLITLLPTSLLPLAEAMNDHRTFLPYIGLVMALAGGVPFLLASSKPVVTLAIAAGAVLLLSASGFATFERNKVWKTEETLWADVAQKSPANPRGLMNYGLTLMGRGDFKNALSYFNRALILSPNYPTLFINLAISEDATGHPTVAEWDFRQALRLAPAAPDSYTYYARFLIQHARAFEATPLLTSALRLSPSDLLAQELAASAAQTPEAWLARSLQLYREGRYQESLQAARSALSLRKDYAEAWNNLGAADNQLGRYREAEAACARALQLKPDFQLARNNQRHAAAREKLAQNPQ